MTIDQLFDIALTSDPGESIVIPCEDRGDLAAKRAVCLRRKGLLAKKFPGQEGCIAISSTKINEVHYLVLTKRVVTVGQPILVKANGEVSLVEEKERKEE
jgi:hypothetical protein